MANEEAKQKVIDELQKKSKSKTKFYFSDLANILELKPREAKKIINEMVSEQSLVYWSSGSTTMYSLPGVGKQAASEGEEK
ncbi:MAG: dissimilatory sulfite reductase D family protein [Desulfohalobiaceae bacterium]